MLDSRFNIDTFTVIYTFARKLIYFGNIPVTVLFKENLLKLIRLLNVLENCRTRVFMDVVMPYGHCYPVNYGSFNSR